MVFQNYALYPNMNMGRSRERRDVRGHRRRVLEVADMLEPTDSLGPRPPLSGGQRQATRPGDRAPALRSA